MLAPAIIGKAQLPIRVPNFIEPIGARADGVTDDLGALQRALDQVPAAGGTVVLQSHRNYFRSGTLYVKPRTTILGNGATITSAGAGVWDASCYWGLSNVEDAVTVLTDEYITIEDIIFDHDALTGLGGSTQPHVIRMNFVSDLMLRNVETIGGASAVAMLGCLRGHELYNKYRDFTNCGSDHWYACQDIWVQFCDMETAAGTGQIALFNPENTAGGGSGLVAKGFHFNHNRCSYTGASGTAKLAQFEPLIAANAVEDMDISHNEWHDCGIYARGDVRRSKIAHNRFISPSGANRVINVGGNGGDYPDRVEVSNNMIFDPETSLANIAVICVVSDTSAALHNSIWGTGYLAAAVSGNGKTPTIVAGHVGP